jgi:hypothetical protein
MNLDYLEEPLLEFAGGLRHVDPRSGIADYGPVDAGTDQAPREIRVGLVGPPRDIEGLRRWLECCRRPIAAKPSHQGNLFPAFPGFDLDRAFRARLVFDERCERAIADSTLRPLKGLPLAERVQWLADIYIQELEALADEGRVQVILCTRPDELLDPDDEDEDDDAEDAKSPAWDFHDLLKAKAMRFHRPLQLVRRKTWLGKDPRPRRAGQQSEQLQDEATRAWNLHTALYYKAGGSPWRLASERSDLSACFVGVSFFHQLEGEDLHTSVAQVFNELGEGVVVRGGNAKVSKHDRQPHLNKADSRQILLDALDGYHREHKTWPARLVLHKSSPFDAAERAGFEAAASERGLHSLELVWLPTHEDVRLFRLAANPPLRGTLLTLDRAHQVLYTRGSVPFYAAYPGMYIPHPLSLRPAQIERSPEQVAREILALTKLNWNNSQFDGRRPVTLRIAERVGNILRYIADGQPLEARYAFYM